MFALLKHVCFVCQVKVWCGEFVHLKFRQQSSHAQCAECIKHKLLIRELSHHLVARQEQVRRYTEHLRSQYYDRVQYWNLRGLSRMRSGAHISCIIDSMDQSKTLLPRSDLCRAKDLSTLIRPKCHITTVIVHGHFVLMALSNHDMPKNSSVMVELMANVLSRLQSVCCLPDVHLHVQADNTVREMKNNPFLKFLSTMTGQGQARDKVFRGVLLDSETFCVLPWKACCGKLLFKTSDLGTRTRTWINSSGPVRLS